MTLRKKAVLYIILCIASLVIARQCLVTVKELTFTKAEVLNIQDADVFLAKKPTALGFTSQSPDAKELVEFRKEIEPVLADAKDEMDLLIKLRHWGRAQQGEFSEERWRGDGFGGENPLHYLQDQRSGTSGACRRFAYILTGALTAAGFEARLVHFASDFRDTTFNHTLAEVWVNSLNKWVLIDSDYDTFYLVNGQLASLMELYRAVQKKEFDSISFERNNSSYRPIPKIYADKEQKEPSLLLKSVQHIYVARTNAFFDGYSVSLFGDKRISFAHYTEKETTPNHPEGRKMALLLSTIAMLGAGVASLYFSARCVVREIKTSV